MNDKKKSNSKKLSLFSQFFHFLGLQNWDNLIFSEKERKIRTQIWNWEKNPPKSMGDFLSSLKYTANDYKIPFNILSVHNWTYKTPSAHSRHYTLDFNLNYWVFSAFKWYSYKLIDHIERFFK